MTAKTMGKCSVEAEYCRQLEAVGSYLKAIRTQKGLSLQQVSQRTHVQPNQLRAIETGDSLKLPEAIYVRGFLKQYAQALGLNGNEIAAQVCVEPSNIQLRWLNQSDFSSRRQKETFKRSHWWAKLTPLV